MIYNRFAYFQAKKLEVDKNCPRKILNNDVKKYKNVAEALFGLKCHIYSEVEQQLMKQHKELSTQHIL